MNASAIGWYHYLYDDRPEANEATKRAKPATTDGQIAYSIAKLKEYDIVDSGDAKKLGIDAMTGARIKAFFDDVVKAGIVKPDIDYKRLYTLQFVNKGVGVALDPKCTAPPAATARIPHSWAVSPQRERRMENSSAVRSQPRPGLRANVRSAP